jgi:hypothetical protein
VRVSCFLLVYLICVAQFVECLLWASQLFVPLVIHNHTFCYIANIIPPLKLQLSCMVQIKETGNLNEKNISTFVLYNCLHLPSYNVSVCVQFAAEYFVIQ